MKLMREKFPNKQPSQLVAYLAKYRVPHAVVGSPMYHKHNLQHLLSMCDAFGLPSFFLTLTMDEAGFSPWPEVCDLPSTLSL